MKKSTKYIILIISNVIIFVSTFIINWDSWGALIPGCIIVLMIYIINPILTIVFFRKDTNRLIRVLLELLISIILFGIARFII